MRQKSLIFALVRAIVMRPSLWITALVEAKRFVPDDWLRRKPYLPIPDPDMIRFRVSTQYGDSESPLVVGLVVGDVLTWLRWCKSENRNRRRS